MQKYNYKGLLVACLIITAISNIKCSLDTKKNTKFLRTEDLSKVITLPDSLVIYNPSDKANYDSNAVNNSELRIYSFVNVSCPSCITHLKKWKEVSTELRAYKVPVFLICQSEDNYELLKYLCEKKDIPELPYPYYFDVANKFFIQNSFLTSKPNEHTVLTNRSNKILASGDLTLLDEVKKQYLSVIKANALQKKIQLN